MQRLIAPDAEKVGWKGYRKTLHLAALEPHPPTSAVGIASDYRIGLAANLTVTQNGRLGGRWIPSPATRCHSCFHKLCPGVCSSYYRRYDKKSQRYRCYGDWASWTAVTFTAAPAACWRSICTSGDTVPPLCCGSRTTTASITIHRACVDDV